MPVLGRGFGGRDVVASAALAVCLGGFGSSAAAAPAGVEIPSVPGLPPVPALPDVPSLPPPPELPSVPPVHIPAPGPVPAPGGIPALPSPAGGAGGTSGGSGGVGSGGTRSGRSVAGGTGGGSASGAPARRRGAGGGGSYARGTPGSRSSARRAYEMRLRSTVRRLRGCIGALPPLQRRVLVLRSGLAGSALSRRQAARRLGISSGSARRAERRGLRTLRRACGGRRGHGLQLAGTTLSSGGAGPLGAGPPGGSLGARLGGSRGARAWPGSSGNSRSRGAHPPAASAAVPPPVARLARDGQASVPWLALTLAAAIATLALVAARRQGARARGGAPPSHQ